MLWNFSITSSMAFSLPQRVNDIFTDNLYLVPWSTPGCICLQLKVPDKEFAEKFALNLSSCCIACTYSISNLFSLQFIQQITTTSPGWDRITAMGTKRGKHSPEASFPSAWERKAMKSKHCNHHEVSKGKHRPGSKQAYNRRSKPSVVRNGLANIFWKSKV